MTAQDAVEFLLAGADAVQVGTANFVNPNAMVEIVQGLAAYMERHGFGHVSELVGAVRLPSSADVCRPR